GRVEGNPTPAPIASAGVIGAGQMGRGIAFALARAGVEVKLVEQDGEQMARAMRAVAEIADREEARGGAKAATTAGRIVAASIKDLGDCDLVIEAIVEDMAVKQALFAELESVVGDNAILATNTSYLDINTMAEGLRDPSRVAGLHFFHPAHVMRLVEVVRTDRASPRVLASLVALSRRMRKLPILARVDDGFVANQMFAAYRQQSEFLLQEGAMPRDVDNAMLEFGMAMGPFAVADLAGLDIAWARRKRQATDRDPQARYVDVPDRLCELGRFGRKTGRGWYDYRSNSAGADDPETAALVLESASQAGIGRSEMDAETITRRLLAAIVNTAADLIGRGTAERQEDIDLAWAHGFGFPRLKGGPLHWARQQEPERIMADVEHMVAASGKGFRVSPALEGLLSNPA
ncbi:MAG: 3-hydroxyacyl-CoA dehydrogenase NAD-binding domain-containing protein, partial [Pseudomonadota bacterium]|nr:3-hydroxyacyl-CoA dehydrogenase NAD-binding domain-containing protein [Pseudomonadota bacterium]